MKNNLKLNPTEWDKFLRDVKRFLVPVGILYVTTVSATIGLQGHVVTLRDFIPNQLMIGGILAYLLSQAQNYLTKLQNQP